LEDLYKEHGENQYEELVPYISIEDREKFIELLYTLLILEDKKNNI
jgi:hypothetical protein